MTDWGRNGRIDTYTYHLIDPFTLKETGETFEVEQDSGSITWAVDSDNWYTGSFEPFIATNRDQLVQVRHHIIVDNAEVSETLGTFFVEGSSATAANGLVIRKLDGYSTLLRHSEDYLVTDFIRNIGDNCVDAIRYIIEVDGGHLVCDSGVNESQTHTVQVWFPAGTCKREVLDTYCEWLGLYMYADPYGYIHIAPYQNPYSIAPKYEFDCGQNCMYVAGYTWSDTASEAYNRVVASWSRSTLPSEDDGYGYGSSVFVDLPETHEFSYERIGRHKTYALSVSDPCSDAELEAQATEFLYANCSNTAYIEIKHVSIPNLRAGDVVSYKNNHDGSKELSMNCYITQMEMELGKGGMCKTKMMVI